MVVYLNNIYLNVEIVQNEKEPLVLLHGNTEDHQIFLPLVARLKEKYCLYLVDSRNHGKSQMTEIFDYDIMADDMISLFTHLKLTKFSILGFSDGAIVATKMVLKAPQLIHKLFLLGLNTSVDGLTQAFLDEVKTALDPYTLMMLQMPSFTSSLDKLTKETYLFYGIHDCIKETHMQDIHKRLKRSKLIVFDDEDHFSYLSKEKFISIL